MSYDEDFYVEESGEREFKVGEKPMFQLVASKIGITLSNPTVTIKRMSDGVDVTTTWWPTGVVSITGGYVQLTPVEMRENGDYELTLEVDADGFLDKRVVFAFVVYP